MAEKFEYKYKAITQEERQEVDSIRRQYLPQEETNDKMSRLKELDNKVKRTPLIFSLTFGIIGTLIFGLGMAFVLEWKEILIGIIVSIGGIIILSLAYPIHKLITKSMKKKYAQQIIDLSNELLNND